MKNAMKFERVSNMVFLSMVCEDGSDIVCKSWMADDFTERKMKNAMKHYNELKGTNVFYIVEPNLF